MDELLSVIVPVYNREDYIDRCVSSILEQSYPSIELILVDDKSTDNSGVICDSWAGRDSRVKVVHLDQNKGVSNARTVGLHMCQGDVITFVDSDDFLAADTYEKNISFFAQDIDIVQYPYREYPDSGLLFRPTSVYIADESAIVENVMKYSINYSLCNKLFKRQVIIGRNFTQNYYEDMEMVVNILYDSPKIYISTFGMYYYFRHPGSETTSRINDVKDKEKYNSIATRAEFVMSTLYKYPGLSSMPECKYWFIVSVFRDLYSRSYRDDRLAHIRNDYNRLPDVSTLKVLLSSMTVKQKLILLHNKFYGLDRTVNRLIHK